MRGKHARNVAELWSVQKLNNELREIVFFEKGKPAMGWNEFDNKHKKAVDKHFV